MAGSFLMYSDMTQSALSSLSERLSSSSYTPSDAAARLMSNEGMYSSQQTLRLPYAIPSTAYDFLLLPDYSIPSFNNRSFSQDLPSRNPNYLPQNPILKPLSQDIAFPFSSLEPQPFPREFASRKRGFEGPLDYGDAAAPAAKRGATSPVLVFRLLVSASRIGKLIGKQGAQIRQFREDTGANIKISELDTDRLDRLITISSKEEGDPSDAEHALIRVASFIILEHSKENLLGEMGAQQLDNLIRLLIAHSEAGILIGKGGETIECIRETTGASVRILPSDQLPKCPYASSTDRLVQISGDLIQVQKALIIIASKLREKALKEEMLKPSPNPVGQLLKEDMPRPSTNTTGQQILHGHVAFPQYILPQQLAAVSNGPKIVTEMTVPNALIGNIIGRGGAKISLIRTHTGCFVKVSDQKEGEKERKISFEGTAEQVVAAQRLVKFFMEDNRRL